MSEAKAKEPKARRKCRARGGGAMFVNQHELARDYGVTPRSIRDWVDRGEFPLPHSTQGTFQLWLRADYDHYIRTGRWPARLKMVPKVT